MLHRFARMSLLLLASFAINGALSNNPLCAQSTMRTLGKIEVLNPSLSKLIDPSSPMEILADGFTWTEGPIWVKREGDDHLLFSDIPRNSIFKWSPKQALPCS